mmetsp:Transcript_26132/g.62083  ORF Transcript_26132/g.62083 Transcript_26132/m.62083 type:complete len:534 (-) Transcript_26132:125-1726(-)
MCAPTTTAADGNGNGNHETKHVVIVGAGPSGLLLSNLLLYRNGQKHNNAGGVVSTTKYRVTLIDSRIDVGRLDVDTELKKYKSWMIALAGHGLEAVRTVPGLYEDYVSKPHVGVKLTEFGLFLGTKKMGGQIDDEENSDQESYAVDRNFVVAALAKYMDDKHGHDQDYLTRMYETSLQYVDSTNRRVLVRPNTPQAGQEQYINYDILIGADGARSAVRECFTRDVYDFEMDFGDIFNDFRAVHVEKPPSLSPSGIFILPEIFPKMTGIVLPMPGNMSNISIGTPRNNFDSIAPELKSDDVKVVSQYFRDNFKAFKLTDYVDVAQKWIDNKRWNRTSMVHCNTYHNTKANAILMGDAAHATSPSIGMGMNTALRDAQKLFELIVEYEDDWPRILPEYSRRRVPEGNSLTDLAFHLYCLDTSTQLMETIHQIVRTKLHQWFPSFVRNHPQAMIGQPRTSLADVYKLSTDLGIIPKHRRINNKIRQEYFEKQIGMVDSDEEVENKKKKGFFGVSYSVAFLGAVVAFGAAYQFLERS